jgi:hypothetical protein
MGFNAARGYPGQGDRQAHARPVQRDHPDTSGFGRLVAPQPLSPRPGMAVAEDEGLAPGVAPFGVAQATAVSQPDRLATDALHRPAGADALRCQPTPSSPAKRYDSRATQA